MQESTKTLLLRGPFLTQSGYGTHARQIAKWVFNSLLEQIPDLEVGAELLPWGMTPWLTNFDKDETVAQLVQSTNNVKNFSDISIQIQLPNEWNPFAANFNIGVTAGVETDKCPSEWITCINRMQMVIVPSEFTKQTFLNTGKVTTPIVVIPLSYHNDYLSKELDQRTVEKLNQTITTDFNFLSVGLLSGNTPDNDRKAMLYTAKWFAEAFKGNPNVGLVFKTGLFRQTHLDRSMTTTVFNKTLLENNLITKEGPNPKFFLVHGNMEEKEMNTLYRHPKIKALVSFTHGEGFGLPLLESAICGLPVIATNWSAHTEYLQSKKWLPVNCSVNEIHPSRIDGKIFLKDFKWAYADEEHAKKRIKNFFDKPEGPKQWAKEMATAIAPKYSEDFISGMHYQQLAEKIKENL
jgi:glycosyltransferase involved in cell wall biosynthesis